MNPLKQFDFSCLDDPAFREDAVREELIAPLFRALGFRAAGKHKIERSKNLKTPFVMVGSTKRPFRIIPDYTLLIDNKPVLVLDAKAPSESVSKREHIWQAYSYAVHPEVRCDHYGICNGRRLVLYAMDTWAPQADFDLSRLDELWPV